MTDEERDRTMDFILVQQAKYSIDLEKLIEAHRRAESRQAKNSVELEKLIEAHRRAENRLALTGQRLDRDEYRLDRDERILKLMITAGRRERGIRAKSDQRLTMPSPNSLRRTNAPKPPLLTRIASLTRSWTLSDSE
jgi:hypothetical protein